MNTLVSSVATRISCLQPMQVLTSMWVQSVVPLMSTRHLLRQVVACPPQVGQLTDIPGGWAPP